MIIRPYVPQDADTTATPSSTVYDSVWAQSGVPQQPPIERVMLAQDKIYVVLAVVLIIWVGLALTIFRTDRKLRRLEASLQDAESSEQRQQSDATGV